MRIEAWSLCVSYVSISTGCLCFHKDLVFMFKHNFLVTWPWVCEGCGVHASVHAALFVNAVGRAGRRRSGQGHRSVTKRGHGARTAGCVRNEASGFEVYGGVYEVYVTFRS